MTTPTSITELSTTASSNAPAGTDSPSSLDDIQRAHASFIAVLRDGGGTFTPAGTGAVATTVQTKLRESVSVPDYGANTTPGTTDMTAAIENAVLNEFVFVPSDTYLSRNALIEAPSMLIGNGTLKQTTADESILIAADSSDINALVENVKVVGVNFGPMPDAASDNWAAFHFNTAKGGSIALSNFKSVWTAVRSGYYLGGAVSIDNLVLGCYIEDAANIGFELIQSKYNRIIGNAIHNSGVAAGLHGVRWSGSGIGNIVVGNSLRDRGTSGISLQVDNTHGMAVGNYIENSGQSGVEVDSVADWEGSHFLGPLIVHDSTLDGFDLDYVSGCYVQALVDTTGQIGIRTSSTASQGKHVIDALVKRAGNGALSVRSGKNLVKILADSTTAGTPVLVSGSNNLVIVLAADNAITNSVYITGSNNTVIVQESGTGTVGLRIDGSGNNITGNITGNLSVVGDSNVMNLSVGGNTTIQAGADNNKLSGICVGTFADNGTDNDCSGILGGNTRGVTTATTTGGGLITVTHGCKKTPIALNATIQMDAAYIAVVTALASTTATVKIFDAAGAAVTGVSVTVAWQAVI